MLFIVSKVLSLFHFVAVYAFILDVSLMLIMIKSFPDVFPDVALRRNHSGELMVKKQTH